jgi:hypothetical protein
MLGLGVLNSFPACENLKSTLFFSMLRFKTLISKTLCLTLTLPRGATLDFIIQSNMHLLHQYTFKMYYESKLLSWC